MSKWNQFVKKALAPITQLPLIPMGLTEAEIEKRGTLRELSYTYVIPLNEDVPEPPHGQDEHLYEAITVTDVHVAVGIGEEEFAHVEVSMFVVEDAEEYLRPLVFNHYPVLQGVFYVLTTFLLTVGAALYFELNMSYMIYLFIFEWLGVLLMLFIWLGKYKTTGMFTTNRGYTEREILLWLRAHNTLFVDLELMRTHKEQLMKTSTS